MSNKHTNSEWFLSKVNNGVGSGGGIAIDAIDPADGELFEVCEVWGVDSDTDLDDRARDNARRIVACVNACRGLPTDELEQKGLVAAVGTELLKRDALVAQMLEALSTVGTHTITDEDGDEIEVLYGDIEMIQDAIAAARGEQ